MLWNHFAKYLVFSALALSLTTASAANNTTSPPQRLSKSQLRRFKAASWWEQVDMIRSAPTTRIAIALAARHVKTYWDPKLPQERSKGVEGLVVGSHSIKPDTGAARVSWAIGGEDVRPVSAEYRLFAVRGRLAIGGNEVRINNGAMDSYWNTKKVRIDIDKVSMADVTRLFPNLTPAVVADALDRPMWYQPFR